MYSLKISSMLLNKTCIFYRSGCVGTHAAAGLWGMLAVGLFARKDYLGHDMTSGGGDYGLFQVLISIYLSH